MKNNQVGINQKIQNKLKEIKDYNEDKGRN